MFSIVMNKSQLLEHLRSHFRADEARFQDGALWLKGFTDQESGILKTEWTETMWSEAFCRRITADRFQPSTR